MKIALIAPVINPIPAKKYGGIELIIELLSVCYAKLGHQVTLYAPLGSKSLHPNIKLVFTTDQEAMPHDKTPAAENKLFKRLVQDQGQFDVIHSHIEPIIARHDKGNYFAEITTPLVITMHNQTYIDANIEYYRNNTKLHNIHYVFISQNQRKPLDFLPITTVINNGIEVDSYVCQEHPKKQLAFLGRITPEKGIDLAIKTALKIGWPLNIAAAIDKSALDYYNTEIKPLIDNDQIKYIGEIDHAGKQKLLGEASALLFPIRWQEPFGLVVVESLACGTPVVASNIGSMPEIIEVSKTGFLCSVENYVDEAVIALNKIDQISRDYCRTSVKSKYDANIMQNKYVYYLMGAI